MVASRHGGHTRAGHWWARVLDTGGHTLAHPRRARALHWGDGSPERHCEQRAETLKLPSR